MSAFTSAQAGNWSDDATWADSGVPGNGDTVSITHAVAVTDARTVGHSPGAGDGTAAIALGTGGTLTITGATLTVRGDLKENATGIAVILGAGGKLHFDPTAAADRTTAAYTWYLGHGGAAATITGTSGSRCEVKTVRTNGDEARAYMSYTTQTVYQGIQSCVYCDFIDFGDATNKSVYGAPNAAGRNFTLQDCTFLRCGYVYVPANSNDTGAILIDRNTWTSGLHASLCIDLRVNNAITTGSRSFTYNACDLAAQFYTMQGWTIRYCYFALGLSSTDGLWAAFNNNLLRKTAQAKTNIWSDVEDSYILQDGSAANPHFLGMPTSRDCAVRRCVFEQDFGDIEGDCVIGQGSPSSSRAWTVENCIFLPNTDGNEQSGTLFTANTTGNTVWTVEHNTYMSSTASTGAAVGESNAGVAGMVASFQSNLVWQPADVGGYIMVAQSPGPADDYITTADYNNRWNVQNSYEPGAAAFLNSPGGNDLNANPSFVDSTRRISKWSASKGASETTDAGLALIAANPALVSDLLAYVQAGFAPTNSALHGTAHDAGDIGAVAWVAGGSLRRQCTMGDLDGGMG